MKMRIRQFSKSSISVVLTLCLLFSCATVGIVATDAARVEGESVGATVTNLNRVKFHANLSGYTGSGTAMSTWSNQSLTNDDNNHYYGTFYTAASQSQKEFGWNVGGSNWGDSWCTMNGQHFTATETVEKTVDMTFSGSNDKVSTISATSGWVKLQIDWYGSYSNSSYVKFYQTAVTALSSSVNVGSSSLRSGQTTTITASSSGGTGTPSNSIKVLRGSSTGTDVTSSVLSGTTFTAPTVSSSTTYYVINTATDPKIGSYTKASTAATITVTPAETTYSVTVESEDTSKGTVAASTVTAGNTAVTIPTATPKYGYKFKQWVATSPAVVASNSTSASTATVRATGTGGKVTAQFEPDNSMNLYIAGRFHVRPSSGSSNWVNSFDSGDWSDTGDDNIKFTYDSGTTYKLETFASPAELTSQISNINPYFFVYDKDNSKGWHPTAGTELTDSNMSASLTTNTATHNVRFNSTSTDTPVTLYFNTVTKELSYDIPTYYTITCNTATGGSVSADAAKQKEGQTVTLTLAPNTGYTINTVTVKDSSNNTVTLSGSGTTRTFTMPASAVTVTATFTETTHTVYVRKRYYQNDGTTLISTETSNTQTLTGVGITTAKQVNAAPSVANYTFYKFTLPTGVTLKTGDLNTSAAITVNATVDSAVIYIDYKETLYTLTLVNNPSAGGSIKKNGTSTAISTISVGNVTGVTLVATPNAGYQFSSWSKSSNSVTIGNTSNNSTTFKTSANATVTANYTATDYTISASASPAAGATVTTTDTSGNSKTGGHVGDTFEIRIVVNTAGGYELTSSPISFQTGTGYVTPTAVSGYPQTSGSTKIYRYTLGAGNAVATVNLKAATPTFSSVKMRDTTHLNTNIDDCSAYANNATVNTYYKQPVYAKATTSDAFTSTFSYATKTTGGTQLGSDTSTPCNITADESIKPTTETGYVEYKLTVTATNAPSGVTAATATRNYTIRVYFNDAQKWYFKLKKLYDRCIEESTSNNPYYKDGAPISAYNTAYNTAKTFINSGYPDYDADSAATANAQSIYNSFNTAYTNLMTYAKTTTVYVLTKYENNASYPMYFHVSSNGTSADWSHFKMYSYGNDEVTNDTYKMSFAGTFEKTASGSTNRYLYSFTFTGHMKFNVWRGTSANDTQMDNADKLTGDISNVIDFKDYYVNVYNTSVDSTSVASASVYADFDHTIASGKKFIEIGQTQTASDIKTLFNITPVGSIVSSPGIDNLTTTKNTAFTIEGPIDKGIHTEVNLKTANFTATTQGRYTVKYTTKFGTNASGADITRTKEMTLYVAFDDVTIYVDMNDNIGNPILNFKYKQKNEVPVAANTSGATDAYLPYEMDLVTGSESIYKYTIKTSKLRDEYFLSFDANNPLNICYITVERTNIGASSGGFDILSEARITGEIWFKADSTHLTTFQTISCGSVTKSFVAATTDGTIISSAVDKLHGTGINTDEAEIYKSQYAALYQLEGASTIMNKFHYVLNAAVKPEVTISNNTYYLDKWVKCSSANVSYTNDNTTVTYSNSENASEEAALSFVSAPEYGDGDNDVTYIALYKPVSSTDTTVRVEVTYHFQDYNTTDGNYIYDGNKPTVDASYTKTIKVPLGVVYTPTSTTYVDFAAVQAAVNTIAQSNVPYIKSNYFDYDYDTQHAAAITENGANTNESKISVDAYLKETARTYTIVYKNGSANQVTYTGYYQQSKTLSTSVTNPVWKMVTYNQSGTSQDTVIGAGSTDFAVKFVSQGGSSSTENDCTIIKVSAGSGSETVAKHSDITESFTEHYYTDSGTEMLRHNFYIVDYCAEGTLKGGGVLFATTDGTNYRQANAATVLASTTTRKNFITGILGSDFEAEYAAQTINNVGFRYKPFKSTEDVFRYSDNLGAYITTYEGSNTNSASYSGQTLRVFSFMVYDNNGTAVVVPSEGYAEVSRYQPQS